MAVLAAGLALGVAGTVMAQGLLEANPALYWAGETGSAMREMSLAVAAGDLELEAAGNMAQARAVVAYNAAGKQAAVALWAATEMFRQNPTDPQARGMYQQMLSAAYGRYMQDISQAWGTLQQESNQGWGAQQQHANAAWGAATQDINGIWQRVSQRMGQIEAAEPADLSDLAAELNASPSTAELNDAEKALADAGKTLDQALADLEKTWAVEAERIVGQRQQSVAEREDALEDYTRRWLVNAQELVDDYQITIRPVLRRLRLGVD